MRWVVVLALTVVSLAGCSEETVEPLDAGTVPPGVGDGNATAPPSGLTAALGLDLPENTTAPLTASFTIDAPGAAVPGNVSWSLTSTLDGTESLVDGGDGVPARATHTFPAGRHLLRLEVTEDGHSAVETVTLVVDAARLEAEDTTEASGAAVATFTGTMAANTDPQADAEVQSHVVEVPEGAAAATLWLRWVTLEATPALADLDVFLKDAAGDVVAESWKTDFEYIHHGEALAPGTYTVEVLGSLVPEATDYELDVIAWRTAPTLQEFTGSFNASAAGEGDPPVDVVTVLPAGTQTVAGRLAWEHADPAEVLASCSPQSRASSDLDLEAVLGGEVRFSSLSALGCEFGHADAGPDGDLGGEWTFTVTPFAGGPTQYTLTVLYA